MKRPRRCHLSFWLSGTAKGALLTLQMQVVLENWTPLGNPKWILMEKDQHLKTRYSLPTNSWSPLSPCLLRAWLKRVSRMLRNTITKLPFNCTQIRTAIQRPKRHSKRSRMPLAKLKKWGTREALRRLLILLPNLVSGSSQSKTLATITSTDTEHIYAAPMFHYYELVAPFNSFRNDPRIPLMGQYMNLIKSWSFQINLIETYKLN